MAVKLPGFWQELRSPEFEVRVASRVDASLCYLSFLRRTADADGMNRWNNRNRNPRRSGYARHNPVSLSDSHCWPRRSDS